MSENTEQQSDLEVVEQFAHKLNEENGRLRAELEQARATEMITVDEQRRRHGDELLGVLLGPNSGAGTPR